MKLQGSDRQIVSNVDNSHKFTIQNNAKMFEILSSRIYTYKTAALVREISWNAHDSHIEAGKADVPFRVVLPNDMHPYFEVEDFGVGLDEVGVSGGFVHPDGTRVGLNEALPIIEEWEKECQKIKDEEGKNYHLAKAPPHPYFEYGYKEIGGIYTSYGNSTKGDSNEVVGAFGLGSKTPFAYTKSFTIQTRKDGREYLFNAYLGNGGEPTVSLTRARDTNKGNGVKIKVPVKTEDFDSFYNEASFILSFFPVRPEVVAGNAFEFDFSKSQVNKISNDSITCMSTEKVMSSLYRNHKLFAVMGGVCYPVKMNDVNLEYEDQSYLSKIILRDSGAAAFVSFDIGELDVNAAREGLSIDEGSRTEKLLKERFTAAVKNSIKMDQENINNCTHPMDAVKYIIDNYGDIVRLVGTSFSYKNKTIASWSYRNIKPGIVSKKYGMLRKSYSSWSRRKTPDYIHEATAYELLKNDFIVIYPETDKIKGLEAKAKRWARRNQRTLVIFYKEPVSQARLNRMYALYRISPKNQITFEEINRIEREERKAKNVHGSQALNLPKKKNTEVTTRGFESIAGRTSYFKNCRVDVSSDEYDYYWIEAAGSGGVDRSLISYTNDQGETSSFAASQMDTISALIDRPIKLLIRNTINKKSIDENDIPYIGELVKHLHDNCKDELKKMYIGSTIFMENKLDKKLCLDGKFSVLEALYKAKSPLLDPDFESFYNDAKNNEQKFLQYCDSPIDTDFFDAVLGKDYDELSDFIESMKSAQKEAYRQYPMIKYVNPSSLRWNKEDERKIEEMAEYMMHIDTAKEMTKSISNAA